MRVFAVDVTVCSKCGGRMKVLEVVTDRVAEITDPDGFAACCKDQPDQCGPALTGEAVGRVAPARRS